jgi:hypothetical protein
MNRLKYIKGQKKGRPKRFASRWIKGRDGVYRRDLGSIYLYIKQTDESDVEWRQWAIFICYQPQMGSGILLARLDTLESAQDYGQEWLERIMENM